MGDSDAEIGNGGMRHGVFTFFSDVKIFYIFADTNSAFKIGGPWRHTRGPPGEEIKVSENWTGR